MKPLPYSAPLKGTVANVTLVVGPVHDPTKFDVMRDNLRISSPVFEKMLDPSGKWKECAARVVSLVDDDPEPFSLLMAILHFQIPPNSKSPGLEALSKLARVADKYQAISPVWPYANCWLKKDFESQCSKTFRSHQARWENVMYVAWTFKLQAIFEKALNYLVMNVAVRSDGSILCAYSDLDGQEEIQTQLLPLGAKNQIVLLRHECMAELMFLTNQFVYDFTNRKSCEAPNCNGPDRERCRASILGSFIRAMSNSSLYPILKINQSSKEVELTRPTKRPRMSSADSNLTSVVSVIRELKETQIFSHHKNCAPMGEWLDMLNKFLNKKVKMTKRQKMHFKNA